MNSFRVPRSLTQTPQFNTRIIPFQHPKFLISTPETPHFNTKIPQIHIKNPSVHHKKSLSSTHPQFWGVCWTEGFWCGTEGFLVLNWGVCWTEGFFGVELRGFLCETEGCVEPRGFWCGNEGFWELKRSCHFVLNWFVELRGDSMISDEIKNQLEKDKHTWVLSGSESSQLQKVPSTAIGKHA